MSLNTTLVVNLISTLTAALDMVSPEAKHAYGKSYSLLDGTGANQANQVFSDTRTLAASASEELDLNGTALQNAFGANIAFTKIKAIIIEAAAGNTNDVLVGGAAANAVASIFGDPTDVLKVKPGGLVVLTAPNVNGYAVTANTADLLKIANSAGTTGVTYSIVIIGVA